MVARRQSHDGTPTATDYRALYEAAERRAVAAESELRLTNAVHDNPNLDPTEMHIWIMLARLWPGLLQSHPGKHGIIIAESTLAKQIGVGKSTLPRHLKRWDKAGYIKRKVVKTEEAGPTGHNLKAISLRLACEETTPAILAYAAGLGVIAAKPKHGGARVSDPCPCCGSTKRVKETRREATIREIVRCECEKTIYSDETHIIQRHHPEYHHFDAATDVGTDIDARLMGELRGIEAAPVEEIPPDTQHWPRSSHDETPEPAPRPRRRKAALRVWVSHLETAAIEQSETPTLPDEPEEWGRDAWPLAP